VPRRVAQSCWRIGRFDLVDAVEVFHACSVLMGVNVAYSEEAEHGGTAFSCHSQAHGADTQLQATAPQTLLFHTPPPFSCEKG